MSIFVRARFAVRAQRREEFERLALALRAQASGEPGTRVYRWFAAGPGRYVVLEEYVDTAAAVAHNERAAALLERVAECAELIDAEVYGAIGPEIEAWVR